MYRDGMPALKIYKLLKKPLSRSGVFKAVKRFRETGTCMQVCTVMGCQL